MIKPLNAQLMVYSNLRRGNAAKPRKKSRLPVERQPYKEGTEKACIRHRSSRGFPMPLWRMPAIDLEEHD